jgi:hypothetical protein
MVDEPNTIVVRLSAQHVSWMKPVGWGLAVAKDLDWNMWRFPLYTAIHADAIEKSRSVALDAVTRQVPLPEPEEGTKDIGVGHLEVPGTVFSAGRGVLPSKP